MADEPPSQDSVAPAQTEQEPRLMISKIVCDNFKSYAGVKELGPFHKVGWDMKNTFSFRTLAL